MLKNSKLILISFKTNFKIRYETKLKLPFLIKFSLCYQKIMVCLKNVYILYTIFNKYITRPK